MQEVQMATYQALQEMMPYAAALNNLVSYSKIDTKKHGKNLVEQNAYLKGYNNLFSQNSKHSSRKRFRTEGLDRMRDMSFIGPKTEIATGCFSTLMAEQTMIATNTFNRQLNQIAEYMNMEEAPDRDLRTLLQNAVMDKMKSRFFFGYKDDEGYCKKHGIDAKGLVNG